MYSVSTSNCHRQLRVRPRGVEIDLLSMGELILELLVETQPRQYRLCTQIIYNDMLHSLSDFNLRCQALHQRVCNANKSLNNIYLFGYNIKRFDEVIERGLYTRSLYEVFVRGLCTRSLYEVFVQGLYTRLLNEVAS
jgi:hypothetical protein